MLHLKIFAHHFLSPARVLVFFALCWLLVWLRTFFVKMTADSPQTIQASLDTLPRHIPALVTIAAWGYAGMWLQDLGQRVVMHTTPVSKYHWQRWNAGVAVVALIAGFAYGPYALPILVAGCLTVASALCRRHSKIASAGLYTFWPMLILVVILVAGLEPMAAFAEASPSAAVFVGLAACLGIPRLFADVSYRRWRQDNPIVMKAAQCLKETDASGRPGSYLPVDGSLRRVAWNVLGGIFWMYRWDEGGFARVLRNFILFVTASMLVFGFMTVVGAPKLGMEDLAFAEFMAPGFLGSQLYLLLVMLVAGRSLMPPGAPLLGRSDSAAVAGRVCRLLGAVMAVSMFVGGVFSSLILYACLGMLDTLLQWESLVLLVAVPVYLLAVCPLALSLGLRKKAALDTQWEWIDAWRVLGVLGLVIPFGGMLLIDGGEELRNAENAASVAGQMALGLGVVAVVAFAFQQFYLKWRFARVNLV